MEPSDIARAVADVLAGMEEMDGASTADFLPTVESMSVFALVVPFEQESTFEQQDLGGDSVFALHMLKVEFWCKHDGAQPGESLRRARSVGTWAVKALLAHDGEGYTIDRNGQFRERVDSGFVTAANVPWLVAHLYVPLENEVTI